jgi:hypothetical protein
MMSETQHTPVPPTKLPWKASPVSSVVGSLITADGLDRASGQANIAAVMPRVNPGECAANAEFICRAVNSHSQLVAALEALLNLSDFQPSDHAFNSCAPES